LRDQGLEPQATEKYRQAMDAYETAARLAPDDAPVLNTLAWHLAISDDPSFRNPARAVVLARRAVELEPDVWALWDTLGVACFYARAWDECGTALERGLALLAEKSNRSINATNARANNIAAAQSKFYLSMAYSRLGNAAKARMWYDQAARWMD